MGASRRTRSGRAAPSAPAKRIRTKQGCLTCRIRRKKCDESREFGGGCETCSRLHIECLGYSTKRPEWLKGTQVDDYKRKIKHFLADHSARSSARNPEEAFLELHHLRTPPRQHSESIHTDSDSESDSDAADAVDVKPQQYSPSYSITAVPVMPELWIPEPPTETPWVPSLDFFGYQEESSPTMYSNYNFAPLDLTSTLVDPMHNEESMLSDFGFETQVTVSQYQYPSPTTGDATSTWHAVLALLPLARADDPEGVAAVAQVLEDGVDLLGYGPLAENQSEFSRRLQARQQAQRCLLKSGYNNPLSRAVTSLWMMQVTLRQGHFDSWGNCLDIIIEWVRERFSSPSAKISDLDANDRRVLSHGIWVDLVAAAAAQRVPLHIDLYRRILRSADSGPIVSDYPNTAVLAFVEAIALAANPTHVPQARVKLQRLRESLVVSPDNSSESAVHTAGIGLYLETVASRGIIDPPVQGAVKSLCEAVGKTPRRAFAFWVFLAGCHTKDPNLWAQCSAIMNNFAQTEGEDGALEAAFGIMSDTYNARKHGSIAPDFWVQKMRERNILLT